MWDRERKKNHEGAVNIEDEPCVAWSQPWCALGAGHALMWMSGSGRQSRGSAVYGWLPPSGWYGVSRISVLLTLHCVNGDGK